MQQRRKQRGPIERLVLTITGLELKMRQYEVGEQFIEDIEREGGPHALDAAWRGPEFLPTLDELAAPSTWLARVGRGEPAPAR